MEWFQNQRNRDWQLPLPLATPIEGVLVGYLKKNQKQYVRKVKVKYYKPGTLVDIWQPYDVKWADRSLKFDRSRKEKNFWNCCSNSPIAFQRGQKIFSSLWDATVSTIRLLLELSCWRQHSARRDARSGEIGSDTNFDIESGAEKTQPKSETICQKS